MSRITRLKQDWDELARHDAFGSVLASWREDPAATHEDFFLRGKQELEYILGFCSRLRLTPALERALDFGCGTGRVAQALAWQFRECWGVDISHEMLSRARSHAAGVKNLRFVLNGDGLQFFADATFTFAYSSRVLQHVPSRHQVETYLSELVRVLKAGGVVVVQVPRWIPIKNRLQPRARLYRLLRTLGVPSTVLLKHLRLTPIRMVARSRRTVESALSTAGADITHVEEYPGGSTLYLAVKQP
jgi:SAM-dependent methyltransferase